VPLNRLQLAFELLLRSVHVDERLEDAAITGLPWKETSITDELLLDLGVRFSGDIEIHSYTGHDEAKTGADWKWEWIFEGDTASFIMLVQAKKLKPIKGGAFGYDFGYRSGRRGRRQIDILLEYARRLDLVAAYALYNGPSLETDGQWQCPALPEHRPFMGVGLLPAEVARYEFGRAPDPHWVNQRAVTSKALPLCCLALCDSLSPCSMCPPDGWPPADLGFPDETVADDLAYRAALVVNSIRFRNIPSRQIDSSYRNFGVHIELPQSIGQRVEAVRAGEPIDVEENGPSGVVILHGARNGED